MEHKVTQSSSKRARKKSVDPWTKKASHLFSFHLKYLNYLSDQNVPLLMTWGNELELSSFSFSFYFLVQLRSEL